MTEVFTNLAIFTAVGVIAFFGFRRVIATGFSPEALAEEAQVQKAMAEQPPKRKRGRPRKMDTKEAHAK